MGAAVLSHGCVYSSGMSIQLTGANKKITLFSHTLSQPLIAPLNMLSEACFFLPPVLKAIWSLMVFRLKIKSSNIQIIFVQEFMYLVWAMSKNTSQMSPFSFPQCEAALVVWDRSGDRSLLCSPVLNFSSFPP